MFELQVNSKVVYLDKENWILNILRPLVNLQNKNKEKQQQTSKAC